MNCPVVEQVDALQRRGLGLLARAPAEQQHGQCQDRAGHQSLEAVPAHEVDAEDGDDDELASARSGQDHAPHREPQGDQGRELRQLRMPRARRRERERQRHERAEQQRELVRITERTAPADAPPFGERPEEADLLARVGDVLLAVLLAYVRVVAGPAVRLALARALAERARRVDRDALGRLLRLVDARAGHQHADGDEHGRQRAPARLGRDGEHDDQHEDGAQADGVPGRRQPVATESPHGDQKTPHDERREPGHLRGGSDGLLAEHDLRRDPEDGERGQDVEHTEGVQRRDELLRPHEDDEDE